jgi:biopolymer transport protein TolR
MTLKNRKNRKSPLAEINVVPYIDVMLVLLVIFMITTPLLSQGVNVDLPHATSQPIASKKQEPIIVSIDAKGLYYLNISPTPDQPIDASALTAQVSAALQTAQATRSESRQVLVKGDQTVDYGKVMQAMVLLQQAGAPGVGLITQPLPQQPK